MIKLEIKSLKKYIKILEKGVNKKIGGEFAYLRNVIIRIEYDRVKLILNNLKMTLEIELKDGDFLLKNIDKKTEIPVELEFIKNFINPLRSGFIEIKDNITDNTIDFYINGNCVSQVLKSYYDPDKFKYETFNFYPFKINSGRFREMLEKTVKFTSKDQTRPALTGQFLEVKENKFTCVAIDGFRVASQFENIDCNIESSCIIYKETSKLISKIIGKRSVLDIKIAMNKDITYFKYDNIKIIAKNIDTGYLQYEQIFHNDYEKFVILNKTEFLNSLKMASYLIGNKKRPVMLEINKSGVLVVVKQYLKFDLYRNVINVVENNNINNFNILFDIQYLLDIFEGIEEEQVKLIFTSRLSPMIVNGHNYKYLCLPMKGNN